MAISYDEIVKKKKKNQNTKANITNLGTSSNQKKVDYSKEDTNKLIDEYLTLMNKNKSTTKTTSTANTKDPNKKWYQQIFDKGEFSNGVDGVGDFAKKTAKTILGTATDITQDVTKGFMSPVENVLDIGTNIVASGVGLFSDKAEKKIRNFADRDLSERASNMVANVLPTGALYNVVSGNAKNMLNPDANDFEKSSVGGYYSDKTSELVGYTLGLIFGGKALSGGKTASIGSKTLGASANAGNIGLSLAGRTLNIPTLALAGGMASGLEEANSKEGVTELERWTKATSSGLIEGITEGLTGMFGVGGVTNQAGKEVFDVIGEKAAKLFSTKAGKVLASVGIKSLGETSEEFLSYTLNYFSDNGIIDKLGKSDFSNEWDWGEVGEQMALAFVSSAIVQGGGSVIETNTAIADAEKQLKRKLTPEEKALVTQASIEGTLEEKVGSLQTQTQEEVQSGVQEQTQDPIVEGQGETTEQVEEIAPVQKETIPPTVEQELTNITNQIDELETMLDTNLTATQQQEVLTQIKALEQRYNEILQQQGQTQNETVFKTANEEIGPVQAVNSEQISNTTTQETKTNSPVEVESNTPNVVKSANSDYNMSNEEVVLDGKRIDGMGTRTIVDTSNARKTTETISEGGNTTREYSPREWQEFERTATERRKTNLSENERKVSKDIKNNFNKEVVFFNDKNSKYKAGASTTNENVIYIQSDENVSNRTQTFEAYHEILESDIYHNKESRKSYIDVAIDEIINDEGFQKTKESFINGQENLKNASDRLIAKDIIADIFAEQQTGINKGYELNLSDETLEVIDYNLQAFNDAVKNKKNVNSQEQQRKTPTQEELDNLEDIRKNKSGSEYASAYYELEKKYGTGLFKGLNNYKSTGKAVDEIAPVQKEIKSLTKEVKELTKELKEVKKIAEVGKPLTIADLEDFYKQTNADFRAITEENKPTRQEDTTPDYEFENDNEGTRDRIESPLIAEGRDMDNVGSRKVKAYQYENPEVKPFFQDMAKQMQYDLQNSTKGERIIIGDISQIGGGDFEYSGVKRHTTPDIADLLDNYNYTYAEINKGLEAIIKDHGAENIAVAKRIEFALDDRLRNGYTAVDGLKIPPNQEYINLLNEKGWADYYNSIPSNDIAPIETSLEQDSAIAPTTENKLSNEDIQRYAMYYRLQAEELNEGLSPSHNHYMTDEKIDKLVNDMLEYINENPVSFEAFAKRSNVSKAKIKKIENTIKGKTQDVAPVQSLAIEQAPTDFDNGGPMIRVSPEMQKRTLNKNTETKNVNWGALEDTSKGEQQALVKKKLGETLEQRDVDWDSLEDTSNSKQKQYNPETGQLEDAIEKKTKKEIKEKLLRETGIMNASLDEANNISKFLMENTDPIRLQEMVFGRSLGNQINDMFFQKVKDNTSEKIRFQNKERAEIKDLGIKARSKESAAVQKYGEKQWVNEYGELVPYGDKELANDFPDVEVQNKIKKASQIIRQKYDSYLDTTNKVLTELGYDAIPKRDDYMRHFQELNDIFSRVGIPYNYNEMTANDLPTDINGLTHDFSPSKNFFANALRRTGVKTTYDAITGIDGYLEGIGNLIYHTEDIQRLRAYEQYIRDTYGQNHGFDNIETLSDEEKVTRIEKIQDNHLSNYASWLHEYTNTLAGKKSLIDRGIEHVFGRKIYSFLNTTKSQVGKNMIGFNIGSAMTNAIAGVQALAKTNKIASVKGLADSVKNIFRNDGFVEKNNFLTSRFGSESISKNWWQKVGDAGFIFMQGMDNFVSNFVVRSKYNELKSKGLSDEQAHIEAGKFASKLMSDRSQGAMPNLYNSQMLGLVTQFQNEVNNQLYSMFYDTYHESRESAQGNALKTTAGMTFTLGQLAIFTHIFGTAFEKMAGYNPTFDIIGILMKAFGLDDDEDSEDTLEDNLEQAFKQLGNALPYISILTGGGRIPISEALPIKELFTGKDEYGNDKSRLKTLKETLPYYVLPTGYSQIKKTTQGLGMYDEDLPIAGSYTDSGNLRFTAEEDTLSKVQAGIFGRWANDEAQAYVDSEFKTIRKENIDELLDLGMKSSEYRKLKEKINKSGDSYAEKVDYIATLNELTNSQKNTLVNNILDRDYEVDVSNYDDYGSYEEFDAFYKNPETYHLGKAIAGNYTAYKEYKDYIWDLKADKDENGDSISGTRKTKVINYVNNLDLSIPQKAMLIRKEYSSFDEYNTEIVEYVSNLDLDYEIKKSVLQELDMTIDEDGYVHWE